MIPPKTQVEIENKQIIEEKATAQTEVKHRKAKKLPVFVSSEDLLISLDALEENIKEDFIEERYNYSDEFGFHSIRVRVYHPECYSHGNDCDCLFCDKKKEKRKQEQGVKDD